MTKIEGNTKNGQEKIHNIMRSRESVVYVLPIINNSSSILILLNNLNSEDLKRIKKRLTWLLLLLYNVCVFIYLSFVAQ